MASTSSQHNLTEFPFSSQTQHQSQSSNPIMLRDIPVSSHVSLSLPTLLPTSTSSHHSGSGFSLSVPLPARSASSSPALLPPTSLAVETLLHPTMSSVAPSYATAPTNFQSSSSQIQDNDTLTMLPLQNQTQAGKKRKRGDLSISTPPSGLEFVDFPPQHLNCPICQNVFNKPVIVNGCGHEFCDECLRRALCNSANCPMCRQSINTSKPFSTPLRRVQEEVDRLRVRCPFSQEGGCDIVVPYGSLDNHIDSCPYAVVDCHHGQHGCEWEGPRQGLAQHLADCQFEKMKGFTHKTASEIAELKSQQSLLQAEVKRLKVVENVFKTRGDRLRELHKQKLGFGQPGIEGQITVVRVAERGAIQWMFKVKTNTKLGKVQEILQLKRGKPVLLTCDGPLQTGGTVIDKNESLYDLGLAASSVSSPNGVVLFAELL